jgi:CRP-like cAMP-binding protein
MLEETTPRYSPAGRLYVPYRTHLRILSDRQNTSSVVASRVPTAQKSYEKIGLGNFGRNPFARRRRELMMPKNSHFYRPASDPTEVDGATLNNELLLDLPDKERRAIYSQLVFLPMRTHDVLNESGAPIRYAYFMNSGLASVLNVMEDGKSVEVGLTGKEGFVGLPLVVGFASSPSRVIIQIEGSAYRISASALVELLRKCPTLEKRLLRYSQVLATQASHVAACNRLHEVDERLARWLLMSQDRIGSDEVSLTQEFLAHMLGTRRSSVTVAASILQTAGLIKYRRGQVNIVDRQGLEAAACECYRALVQQSSRWRDESN